jgi:hypothetical protein
MRQFTMLIDNNNPKYINGLNDENKKIKKPPINTNDVNIIGRDV